ncbi:hypothetical protein [Mycolicibacterium goodii]|uniref:hypothetical protein n=1 Tax=Mycolicibacterium goodii TaxID=134601 RepID=UPI001BDD2176|nr:hypothetical protein [Mycolicibacterium goodii]MBU8833312.1 hypothetical protein [Mycolicibacterium goodii]
MILALGLQQKKGFGEGRLRIQPELTVVCGLHLQPQRKTCDETKPEQIFDLVPAERYLLDDSVVAERRSLERLAAAEKNDRRVAAGCDER